MSKSLKNFSQKLAHHSLARYIFIGGVTYIFDIGILVGFYNGLHTSQSLAASASFWAGLLFSFLLQKLVAFQDYQKEVKAISRQAVWYALLVAVNYLITVTIVNLFAGKYIILSRTLALLVTTCWNYLIYKKLIFRNDTKPQG